MTRAYLNVESLDFRIREEEVVGRLPERVLGLFTDHCVLHSVANLQDTVGRGLLKELETLKSIERRVEGGNG